MQNVSESSEKEREKNVKAVILNLLYPGRCIFCGKVGESICCRCEKKMIWIREPRCMRCGKMLKDEVAEYCEDCAKKGNLISHREGASGCIRNRYRMHYTGLSIIINDVMD